MKLFCIPLQLNYFIRIAIFQTILLELATGSVLPRPNIKQRSTTQITNLDKKYTGEETIVIVTSSELPKQIPPPPTPTKPHRPTPRYDVTLNAKELPYKSGFHVPTLVLLDWGIGIYKVGENKDLLEPRLNLLHVIQTGAFIFAWRGTLTKMMNQRVEKKTLSKSILEMKFMKQSKEKYIKEKDEAEGQAIFASEVTEAMKAGANKFIIEPSYVPCEGLIVGRLSYHGMNPEIEKLINREKVKEEEHKSNEVDISDIEMARRYSTLIGTISNKFKSKNLTWTNTEARPKKRTKFMKPEDD